MSLKNEERCEVCRRRLSECTCPPPSTGNGEIVAKIFFSVIFLAIIVLVATFVFPEHELSQKIQSFLPSSFVSQEFIVYADAEEVSATATPFKPEINPTIIPNFVVQECKVQGAGADRVVSYKVSFREIDGMQVPNFISDEGDLVSEEFPSFEGKEFLLVCFPKELGSSWATQTKSDGSVYQDLFFELIGSKPINEKTGQEDTSTIERGFWLFVNPELYTSNGGTNTTIHGEDNGEKDAEPSPTPTETPAPTLQPTPTVMVPEVVSVVYEKVPFEDLMYDRNLGSQVWEQCGSQSLEFRQAEGFYGTIEAACPSFSDPTVHIQWVTGLGEAYNLYWHGGSGGGTWYVRGGRMSYGNGGNETYIYTNSLGVEMYSKGIGFVTLSPVQLFQPTPIPPTPEPQITPSPTSWFPQVGCAEITWDWLKSNTQVLTNEKGDTVLIRRADGYWWGNNNPTNCYLISGLPTDVVDIDSGKEGTWKLTTGGAISLGWLDSSYEGNIFFYHVSNYIWVGMVDPK